MKVTFIRRPIYIFEYFKNQNLLFILSVFTVAVSIAQLLKVNSNYDIKMLFIFSLCSGIAGVLISVFEITGLIHCDIIPYYKKRKNFKDFVYKLVVEIEYVSPGCMYLLYADEEGILHIYINLYDVDKDEKKKLQQFVKRLCNLYLYHSEYELHFDENDWDINEKNYPIVSNETKLEGLKIEFCTLMNCVKEDIEESW